MNFGQQIIHYIIRGLSNDCLFSGCLLKNPITSRVAKISPIKAKHPKTAPSTPHITNVDNPLMSSEYIEFKKSEEHLLSM